MPSLILEAQRLHRQFDSQLPALTAGVGRIYCRRGCGGCCSLPVEATFAEAAAIAPILDAGEAAALESHVGSLLELVGEADDLKAFWRARRALGACPFLDGAGACRVYALRPLACRALLATRNSDWCVADFGALHPGERQAFMSGLDRSLVEFPTHYLAAPKELAARLERRLLQGMYRQYGFTLRGNLPLLVHHIRSRGLAPAVERGAEATARLLENQNASHPFLTTLK